MLPAALFHVNFPKVSGSKNHLTIRDKSGKISSSYFPSEIEWQTVADPDTLINPDTPHSAPQGDARTRVLRAYGILNTPPEVAFNDLVRLAAQVCDTPSSFITFVDDNRQFFKAAVGTDGVREATLESGFCPFTVRLGEMLVIPDTLADPRFRDNPAAYAKPPVRFYAGVPIHEPGGLVLGTLCVVDRRPRKLPPDQIESLRALGRQVETQLLLRQAAGQRKALVAAQQEVAQTTSDLDAALTIVVRRAQEIAGADGAAVEIAEGEDMVYRTASGTAADHIGLRLRRQTSLSGRCIAEGRPLSCEDTENDPRVDREACRRIGVRSMIVVPLQYLGSTVGVLKVCSAMPQAFGADVLPLLALMVSMIVAAMSAAAEVEARQALSVSEERQRFALEGAGIGTWHWDIPSNRLAWSDRCKALFGVYTETPMTRALFFDRIHPDDREATQEAVNWSLAEGTAYDIEYRVVWPDKSVHWIAAKGRGYQDEAGRATRFEGTVQDIDERKAAEATLREAAEHQRTLLRDVLLSVTGGRLRLAETEADLPAAQPEAGDPIPLTATEGLKTVRQVVKEEAIRLGFTDERWQDLMTAASEGGMNAVTHGGGHGEATVSTDGRGVVQVRVRDWGSGINMENLPNAALSRGWSSTASLGHGLVMMLQSVDRLWLLTGPGGTTVVVEQDREEPPPSWL